MTLNQNSLQNLYDAFNKREIEKIISMMAKDVKWANGMEGGYVDGRDNVREYWRRQFKVIEGELTPLKFEIEENSATVKLRQIVRDLQGNVLDDKTVEHIFTFENGLIKIFEIGSFTKPLKENDIFQNLMNNS